MRIKVICTGDDVLSGKTFNTNFSRLSRRLTELGLLVVREITVGDDRAELHAAFATVAGSADAVIVKWPRDEGGRPQPERGGGSGGRGAQP